MRRVENEECGKCGVWKMRCVENVECRKCVENFNFPFSILVMSMLSAENEACVIWKLTNNL